MEQAEVENQTKCTQQAQAEYFKVSVETNTEASVALNDVLKEKGAEMFRTWHQYIAEAEKLRDVKIRIANAVEKRDKEYRTKTVNLQRDENENQEQDFEQAEIDKLNKSKHQAEADLHMLSSDYNAVTSNNAPNVGTCLLYTSPSPRDQRGSRMPSSA